MSNKSDTTDISTNRFFEQPILNSPYEYPEKHWELKDGIPTQKILNYRRKADFITPIPKPKKYTKKNERIIEEGSLFGITDNTYATAENISNRKQKYHLSLINEIRNYVNKWRNLPENDWNVTGVTRRLLKHWRTYNFNSIKPFFCQIEAVETAIWLTEVVRRQKLKKQLAILQYLDEVNGEANPGLSRIALKLATGAGKTTVMAMLIAWQTLNAVRSPDSQYFTKGFLIVAPGITIKDRLRVLNPNDPDSYYESREIVPQDMLRDLQQARVVITNYHALKLREKIDISKGTRSALEGWREESLKTLESEGEMLQRVMPELMNLKNVVIFNDEAHHCYKEKTRSSEEADSSPKLSAEEKTEAEENKEAARVWISGLEILGRVKNIIKVFDLSATPFFISGSGYIEGTIFPWTMSDFSLMDAIECGIVKLPRVPVAGNISGQEVPMYRDLWKHIKKDMPKKKGGNPPDPLALPVKLQTALEALYGHYKQTFEMWQSEKMPVPPCFIIVCNNTVTSKLIYDFVSGFYQTNQDGSKHLVNGRYELFRNFDDNGEPYPRPRTLLIDSQQLDRDDALDSNFAAAAKDEIERFKREIQIRHDTSLLKQSKNGDLPDAVILREVMNTVGKQGRLGETIRCVVSVSMLTEGWDANTVTHILGVRAFGTQLLCEQVIGRALRRYCYELNDQNLFDTEYADILGIPFDFADRQVDSKPKKPRETVHVRAMRPERDKCEIIFPRVAGYRVELPGEKLTASFTEDSKFVLTPEIVGETEVQNAGIIGESVNLNLQHLDSVRENTIKMQLTKHLLVNKFRDANGDVKLYLFGQLKKIVNDWFDKYLQCDGGTYPAQLLYLPLADRVGEKIVNAVTRAYQDERPIRALLDPFNPSGSTRYVNFNTSETRRYQTDPQRSHLNWHICDSDWELEFCRVAESHERVRSYVKNRSMGFEVPYTLAGEKHIYIPDFIVKVDDGHGDEDLLHIVVEVKGYRNEAAKEKKETMDTYWIPGVNRLRDYGRWAFVELKEVYRIESDFDEKVNESFNTMVQTAMESARG